MVEIGHFTWRKNCVFTGRLFVMPRGGYSGFQVTGFEMFDSGMFLGWKIWQVFF